MLLKMAMILLGFIFVLPHVTLGLISICGICSCPSDKSDWIVCNYEQAHKLNPATIYYESGLGAGLLMAPPYCDKLTVVADRISMPRGNVQCGTSTAAPFHVKLHSTESARSRSLPASRQPPPSRTVGQSPQAPRRVQAGQPTGAPHVSTASWHRFGQRELPTSSSDTSRPAASFELDKGHLGDRAYSIVTPVTPNPHEIALLSVCLGGGCTVVILLLIIILLLVQRRRNHRPVQHTRHIDMDESNIGDAHVATYENVALAPPTVGTSCSDRSTIYNGRLACELRSELLERHHASALRSDPPPSCSTMRDAAFSDDGEFEEVDLAASVNRAPLCLSKPATH